jgi:hypothetical protein
LMDALPVILPHFVRKSNLHALQVLAYGLRDDFVDVIAHGEMSISSDGAYAGGRCGARLTFACGV